MSMNKEKILKKIKKILAENSQIIPEEACLPENILTVVTSLLDEITTFPLDEIQYNEFVVNCSNALDNLKLAINIMYLDELVSFPAYFRKRMIEVWEAHARPIATKIYLEKIKKHKEQVLTGIKKVIATLEHSSLLSKDKDQVIEFTQDIGAKVLSTMTADLFDKTRYEGYVNAVACHLTRHGIKFRIVIEEKDLGGWDAYFKSEMMNYWLTTTMAAEELESKVSAEVVDADSHVNLTQPQQVVFFVSRSVPMVLQQPIQHPNPIQHVQDRLDIIKTSITNEELKNYSKEFCEILSFMQGYATQIGEREMDHFKTQLKELCGPAKDLFARETEGLDSVSNSLKAPGSASVPETPKFIIAKSIS